MKNLLISLVVALGLSGISQAEVVSGVEVTASINTIEPGAKIYLTDTGTKSYEKLEGMLKAAGYQVVERRDDADYYVSIFKIQMLVETEGKNIYIDHYNIEDFKDFQVKASVDSSEVKVGSAELPQGGKVRGVFDMDAGVIAQGSRLTGSGAGGFAIGMIGGLVGGLIDRSASKGDEPPKDMVFVRGAVTKKGETKGAKLVIGVGSTAQTTPAPMFDEALKVYLKTVTKGFTKAEKAS